MNFWFVITSFVIIVYMGIQTKEDKKTKTVYTALNNWMIVGMAVVYAIRCIVLDVPIFWQSYLWSILFLALHPFIVYKFMGIGDAKALVVFFLQSGLLFFDGTFDILFPIFIYFIANILFTIAVIADGIKQKKKAKEIFFGKGRRAFFPYLFPSYIVSAIMWIIAY